MRLKLFFALFILLNFAIIGKAEVVSGSCGIEGRSIIGWSLDTETGVLHLERLEGTGVMTDFTANSTDAWLNYRNNIKKVIIGDSILSIGNYAFYRCTELEEVITPETEFGAIKDQKGWYIGTLAFAECSSLKKFTFPKGENYLGNSSFQNCTSLESVYISGSLSAYYNNTPCFAGCTNLKNVYIENLKSYSSNESPTYSCGVFQYAENVYIEGKQIKDVVIPEGVTHLSAGLFDMCKTIKSVKLPSTIEYIGAYAFYGSSIESVTIPTTNLQEIDEAAFAYCDALKEAHIDDYKKWAKVRTGGQFSGSPLINNALLIVNGSEIAGDIVLDGGVYPYAFSGCKKITSVTFINDNNHGFIGVDIMHDAFSGCTGIKSINIPRSADASKIYYMFHQYSFSGCSALEKVEIPACGRLYLLKGAFQDCGNIELSIDATMITHTNIAKGAFARCTGNAYINTYNNSDLRNILAGTKFSNITLGKDVTKIPNYLFENYTSLEEITMEYVTEISEKAFAGCTALYGVGISQEMKHIGTHAFDSCTALRYMLWPDGATIDDYAFANCTNLEDINASNLNSVGANVIENTALYNNAPTGNVYIGDWLVAYKKDVFAPYVHIPAGIKGIASEVFANDTLLAHVYLNEVKYINNNAFSGCTNLHNIASDGEPVEYIGENAFNGCTNLSDPRILVNAKEIGSKAFYNCSSLPAIDCFKLEKLGERAFQGCTSAQVIGSLGSITEIPYYAFYNCSNLVQCEIPTTVKTIGENALRQCSSLKKITIPNSVNSIADHAFRKNSALDTVIIASHNVFIGRGAFMDCDSIKAVYILSDSVPTYYMPTVTTNRPFMTGNIRKGPEPRGTLYVPLGCKDKYPEDITKDFVEVAEMDMTALRNATGIDTPIDTNDEKIISTMDEKLIIGNIKIGEVIRIYSVTGSLLMSVPAERDKIEIPTDGISGIVIVHVGTKAYKVIL